MKEAKLMCKNKLFSGATNRAYYSCFYIVSAALLTDELSSKTHKGVRSLFFKNFVSTGEIPEEQSKFFAELYNLRQQSDYDFFVEIEPENAIRIIESSEAFINIVKKMIIQRI